MTKELLVTGGLLRKGGFELGEGKYYGTAVVVKLDLSNGDISTVISIEDGNENYPPEHPNLQFTAGCIDGDFVWLPTDTEVRLYKLSDMSLQKTYSHSCFQNIHSVALRNNQLYVTSTGLDMVVVLDKATGDIVDAINAEGKHVWHRFSHEIDYRLVHSTRPHDCHPNYIFWINEEAWVTRCTQEDAVNITNLDKRIDISGPNKQISVHDGIVVGDKVYFTSVDACLVVADGKSHTVDETIDLSGFKGFGGARGWCRGLCYSDGVFYLGFSRLRRTKSVNKLKWVHKFTGRGKVHDQCTIIGFDINKREIVSDFEIPGEHLDAIYTVLPLAD